MNLALDNLQRLICHKTQPKKPIQFIQLNCVLTLNWIL